MLLTLKINRLLREINLHKENGQPPDGTLKLTSVTNLRGKKTVAFM